MSDDTLYDALIGLTEAEFEEVLGRSEARKASLPSQSAALTTRAAALLSMAAGKAGLRERLWEALAKVRPAQAKSSLSAWLNSRRSKFALVRVPGPDRDVAFEVEDLVVPLQLQIHRRGSGEGDADRMPDAVEMQTMTGDFREAFGVVAQRSLCLGLAVIGDPGSGKTTLLQQIFCTAHTSGSQALDLPEGLTPVFVRCKAFERVERPWWSFQAIVENQAAADGHPGASAALFAEEQPLLLLLDGLDEVRDEETRKELCRWLGEEALAKRDRWRFVVTSRIATWRRESRLSEDYFLTADVLALDEPTIRTYVGLWFRAVRLRERLHETEGQLNQEAEAKATALLKALYSEERQRDRHLLELMSNPLSLALLCQVHTRYADLPTRRSELYEACLQVFLERRAREQERPFLPAKPARAVLQPLAWAMQVRATDDLTRKEIEEEIGPHLRRLPDLKTMDAAVFVKTAWEECGVFRSRDFQTLGFFHAALREYLAATYAVEERKLADLASRTGEDRWRNVMLLAMSLKGGFSGLAEALLAGGQFAANEELLREGLRSAMSVEPEPFVAALHAATPRRQTRPAGWLAVAFTAFRRSGPRDAPTRPEDVLTVLRLFKDRQEPEILQAARGLEHHEDERVKHAVCDALALAQATRSAPIVVSTPDPTGRGQLWREPVTGLACVWIPPGEFWMDSSNEPGQPDYDTGAFEAETSFRRVRLSQGFWIGQHPVTNEVYARFLSVKPRAEPTYWRNARFNKPEQPVVGVSLDDAAAFCAWATKASALPEPSRFELPSEAEWEYTARAAGGDGKSRRYPWGDDEPTPERAVFRSEAAQPDRPAVVGGRQGGATPLGVHDMAGNVWEWCVDVYGPYPKLIVEQVGVDERGASSDAASRVVRGGAWGLVAGYRGAAHRGERNPGFRHDDLGFRVVCRRSRQNVGLIAHGVG